MRLGLAKVTWPVNVHRIYKEHDVTCELPLVYKEHDMTFELPLVYKEHGMTFEVPLDYKEHESSSWCNLNNWPRRSQQTVRDYLVINSYSVLIQF